MRLIDTLLFCGHTLLKQRFKSLMLFLSIGIGVMSVILLTGLGEGGRMFVLGEFSMLGNQTLVMVPGKKQTEGGLPPLTGESSKPISLLDAKAIAQLNSVEAVAPLVAGNATVSTKQESSQPKNANLGKLEILIAGSTNELLDIMGIDVIQGQAFTKRAWDKAMPQVLIGMELKSQLFATQNAVGQWIRVADRRYQVSGVIQSSGSNLGLNFNNMVFMPIQSSMQLFNLDGLFRVFIKLKHRSQIESGKTRIIHLMNERQNGIADVTIVSQNAILSSFDNVMFAVNLAVTGIGVISLLVAGILIMNVTLISIAQRTKEIGLLRAIGASRQQVRWIFLTEAGLIASIGSVFGWLVSALLLTLLRQQFPSVPFQAPSWAIVSGFLIALFCSLGFAWLPASKAANLSIISALNGQSTEES